MADPGGTGTRALTVDLVPLPGVSERVLRAWHELAADAVEPNPFFEPEMLLPAVRHLPGGDDVRLVTVWRGERLVLAMPVTRTRYRRVPVLGLATWRHPYCFLGTPLVRADGLADAPTAALLRLRRLPPGWFALEQVYLDGPVMAAFRRAAAATSATWTERGIWARPVVRNRSGDAGAAERLSARSAKTLRRLRRNLERDIGPVESVAFDGHGDPVGLEAEVDAFLDMELGSWKGRSGTALACADDHAAFFRETCRAFAASGRLALWRLQAGNVATARECHLRSGDTVFAWKTAFDEQFGRFSPGVQLERDVLDALLADPVARWLDTCTGDVPTNSARLSSDRRLIGDVLLGLTRRGRAIMALRSIAAASRRHLRAVRRGAERSAAEDDPPRGR